MLQIELVCVNTTYFQAFLMHSIDLTAELYTTNTISIHTNTRIWEKNRLI